MVSTAKEVPPLIHYLLLRVGGPVFFLLLAPVARSADAASGAIQGNSNSGTPLKPWRVVIGVRPPVPGLRGGSFADLRDAARREGVDAVILAGDLHRGLQYGFPPLRHLFWIALERPDILSYGVENYLRTVRKANEISSKVLFLPGYRVRPRYYWTGSLWRSLTCNDYDRTILLIGTGTPSALPKLPFGAGYVSRRDPWWIFFSRLFLVVYIALIVGYFHVPAWVRHRFRIRRRKTKGVYFVFILLPATAGIIFFNLAAASQGRLNVHGRESGQDTVQQVLDAAWQNGYLVVWSRPQEGFARYQWPILFRTEPQPSVLATSQNYHGFSCFSLSGQPLAVPGGPWDRKLSEYVRQLSSWPVWAVADVPPGSDASAFHCGTSWCIENVVFASERTPKALLDAFEKGRFYARRSTSGNCIRIDRFTVEGLTFGQRGASSNKRFEIDIAVSCSNPGAPLKVTVVRNGKPVYEFESPSPVTRKISDPIDRFEERFFYRVIIKGPGLLEALGQPVFIRYVSPDLPPKSDFF